MIGLILAAGRSSRLGEPKILIQYQGKSLLERTCQQALSVCSEILVLIGAETEKSSQILNRLQAANPKVHFTISEHWSEGMGSTLAEGLRMLADKQEDIMVMLCDLPFIEASHLSALQNAKQLHPQLFIVSDFGGQMSPPVVIPQHFQPQFYHWKGEKGLGEIWHKQAKDVLYCHFNVQYKDLDTPDDKAYWRVVEIQNTVD
jgi:molybdenum cofactor cytidylyltransferase